jgi:hypothetical protein
MDKKEQIEKAISDISRLIMDFSDAVDSLRGVRELLYSFIEEKEPEDERKNPID